MGWKLKGLAIFFAVWAVASGAFVIGIPILCLLAYRHRARRKPRTKVESENSKSWIRWMDLVGACLLLLSICAAFSGGIFSPVVFGALGLGALLYKRRIGLVFPTAFAWTEDSVMLRNKWLPFQWSMVAEIKLLTRQPSKAIVAAGGRLVVVVRAKARLFVILEEKSIGRGRAENLATERLKELSETLGPLGAYVLPLHGEEAIEVMSGSTVNGNRWESDFIRLDSTPKATLWESASMLEKRFEWADPDELTTFLTSVYATRGESLGQRMMNVGDTGSATMLVRSVRTPSVDLSRAQTRVLIGAYA